jgi:VWFA-related protein
MSSNHYSWRMLVAVVLLLAGLVLVAQAAVFPAAIVLALGVTLNPVVKAQGKEASPPRSSPQEPSAVLKVTTRLVTVDVVARDHHGNAVRDLRQGDFQIFEQAGSRKMAQQIASFRLLDRSLSKVPESQRSALQIPIGAFTNLVTTQELSAPPTILLVDGLNTDPTIQVQTRQKMVQLLASAPSDIPVAVFLLGRELRMLQNFTTDARLLREAAQRAMSTDASNLQVKDPRDDPFSNTSLMEKMAGAEGQNNIPGGAPSGAGAGSAALLAMKARNLQRFERESYADATDIRAQLTLDALRIIARHLSGYPGRKNLIWISSAFPLVIVPDVDVNAPFNVRFSGMRSYANEISGVASALTDARIAVYPVDPSGIETQQQFSASSARRTPNSFSDGATLNRESTVRFSNQQSMQDLAEQTGGQVCLNSNDLSQCINRAIDDGSSYYELTYYPVDRNWHGEFRKLSVKTRRSGVQLAFREGYFARASHSNISTSEAKDLDTLVMHAACNDFLSATAILMSAKAVPSDQPGQAKYFLAVDPNALSFGSPKGGVRALHLELSACMFNARGSPLQYFRQSVGQKFNESEYESTLVSGITHTMSIVPKPETARVRLLVCDTATGMIGSVDIPYFSEASSRPFLQAGNKSDALSSLQTSSSMPVPSVPEPAAPPHVIKFHDKEGRTGILEWDSRKLIYSGDLSPDASARGMFDSLWGKSYSCQAGRLVSVTDRKTPAQQPLHFESENRILDVYLDDATSVRFSGDLLIDSSAKPLFEALRTLYQCKASTTAVQ